MTFSLTNISDQTQRVRFNLSTKFYEPNPYVRFEGGGWENLCEKIAKSGFTHLITQLFRKSELVGEHTGLFVPEPDFGFDLAPQEQRVFTLVKFLPNTLYWIEAVAQKKGKFEVNFFDSFATLNENEVKFSMIGANYLTFLEDFRKGNFGIALQSLITDTKLSELSWAFNGNPIPAFAFEKGLPQLLTREIPIEELPKATGEWYRFPMGTSSKGVESLALTLPMQAGESVLLGFLVYC